VRNTITGQTWPSVAAAARAAGFSKQWLSQNLQWFDLVIDNNVDTN
jgi:hypothetical protein